MVSSLTLRPTAPYLPNQRPAVCSESSKRRTVQMGEESNTSQPVSRFLSYQATCCTNASNFQAHSMSFVYLELSLLQHAKLKHMSGSHIAQKKMMRSMHLLSPRRYPTYSANKTWLKPCQRSMNTRAAQPESVKLFVPSGYLHSAALRSLAGVAN